MCDSESDYVWRVACCVCGRGTALRVGLHVETWREKYWYLKSSGPILHRSAPRKPSRFVCDSHTSISGHTPLTSTRTPGPLHFECRGAPVVRRGDARVAPPCPTPPRVCGEVYTLPRPYPAAHTHTTSRDQLNNTQHHAHVEGGSPRGPPRAPPLPQTSPTSEPSLAYRPVSVGGPARLSRRRGRRSRRRTYSERSRREVGERSARGGCAVTDSGM